MSAASVDLRSFVYALAAQLQKHRWELERLQVRAAQAALMAEQLETQRKTLSRRCDEQQAYLADSTRRRPDPAMHGRALDYLVSLRERMLALENDVQAARREHQDWQQRCIVRQQKIRMLEEHRDAQLQEYIAAEQARHASELDREWSARSLWRARTATASPAEKT